MTATTRVLEKLDNLIGAELEAVDVRFVLKYWDEAGAKLQRSVVAWFKEQTKTTPALQVHFIEVDARAVKSIKDLSPQAQELIMTEREFKDDIPVMVAHARGYTHIHESLWKALIKAARANELRAVAAKALAARTDCPQLFLKAAGVSPTQARRSRVVVDETRQVRPGSEAQTPTRRQRGKAAPKPAHSNPEDDFAFDDTVKTPRRRSTDTQRGAIDKVRQVFGKASERNVLAENVKHAARTVRRPRT